MLVKSCHVHLDVAHDIHHGHHIARSVHRIGTEPVPSTIEHNGVGYLASPISAPEGAWCWRTTSRAELLWRDQFQSGISGVLARGEWFRGVIVSKGGSVSYIGLKLEMHASGSGACIFVVYLGADLG
jgi:hypothetical protein